MPGPTLAADSPGQDWPEAQEPSVRPSAPADAAARPASGVNPVTAVLLAGIGFYRSDIGPGSIARCPFKTSCSRFAQISLGRWGLFGLVPFTDRFLYRENVQTGSLYLAIPSSQTGASKSDDDFYLPPP